MIFKLNLILLLLILFLFSNATIEKRREDNEQDEDIEEVKNDPNTDNLVLLNSEGELRKREDLDEELKESGEDEEIDVFEDKKTKITARIVLMDSKGDLKDKNGFNNLQAEVLYENALNILSKKRWSEIAQKDIRAAYTDLEEADKLGSDDAKKILAFSYLFGDYRWSIDEAIKIFEQLASETGSADAHLGLGFLHSTGAGMKDGPNIGLGFLHYTFAALGGNPLAQMALGYRYGHGIGVKQDCETALTWYKKVANKVAKKVKLTGMPSVQRIRIPDEIESSSIAGTILDTNVFSYYKYLAETGDIQAVLGLAQLYLTGGKGVPMDLQAARKYFQIAADAGSAQANGQAGIGIMYLYGYGIKADSQKALKFFAAAAEQGSSDAQLHLGQIDFKQALKHFQLASQSGHILAIYNLAQMHAKGTGVFRNCKFAVALYKNVAERGRWTERFMDAYLKFQNNAIDEAAFRYLFLAELGYEAAQTNFAYLIDSQEGGGKDEKLAFDSDLQEAAEHYKIAAQTHQNAQAMFNLGYMHENGIGVNKDLYLAKRFYDSAAETSTDAFWPVTIALMKLKIEFLMMNFAQRGGISFKFLDNLDTLLGPDWDLYAMSLAFGLAVWLGICYFRNRFARDISGEGKFK
uniref:Sel-1 protein n=1 Tax=Meloidogyne floridensis TaxID=298350 RepID=A0A915P1U3_9BILA